MPAFSSRKQLNRGLSNRRPNARLLVVIGAVVIFAIYHLTKRSKSVTTYPSPTTDRPPTYDKLRNWEMRLPQNNLSLPAPEGQNGRYVYFANQVERLGWNNVLNEVLMNSLLAHESGRAYVFRDYKWNPDHYPWPQAVHQVYQPLTPATALLSGPTVGGPWAPDDPSPRSIPEAWFNIVCPPSKRRVVNSRDIKKPVYWDNGDVIFEHWKKFLREAPEGCLEIQPATWDEDHVPQAFDLWLWGSTRILPLWEKFRDSPVSRLLEPSPIVKSAVARNQYLFFPRGPRLPHTNDPFDRTLAIHLRRGDYKNACVGFANWNSTFYSWNLLPFLPDKFAHPVGAGDGKSTPEAQAEYMRHCYPDEDLVLEKIRQARKAFIKEAKPGEQRVLDMIYLLTNDKTEFIDNLKRRLEEDGWYNIITTLDLELDTEQKDVGMAVDMEFGRKAAVFVGNGWSSFTSNVIHQRLVDGRTPISNRFL